MTDATFPIERLRKRAEFLACAKSLSLARGAVLVQARDREDGQALVNAVVRNRANRRMREAARLLLPDFAQPGRDYVFIARGGLATREWARLLDDMKSALIRLAADSDRRAGGSSPAPSSV